MPVPMHIKESIDNFVKSGTKPGGLVYAILTNNLMDTVTGICPNDFGDLKDIVYYMINYLPEGCWGSKTKVELWMSKKNYVKV